VAGIAPARRGMAVGTVGAPAAGDRSKQLHRNLTVSWKTATCEPSTGDRGIEIADGLPAGRETGESDFCIHRLRGP
jgi:hypothetical protein